jgi:hypothetical protein
MAPLVWEWMKRLEFGEFVYKANQKKKKKNNVSQTHNNNKVTATTPTTPLGLA